MITLQTSVRMLAILATLVPLTTASGQTDWRPHPELHFREESEMVYDETRDRIVLFGGIAAHGFTGAWIELNDTWEWDGTSWTYRRPAHSPSPRLGHAMAYDYARKTVLLFGGFHYSPTPTPSYRDTWEWDGHDWTQLYAASGPREGGFTSMASNPVRQEILAFGGRQSNFTAAYDDTWIWDGTRWTQRFPLTRPAPRGMAPMAFDPSTGRITMTGGMVGFLTRDGDDIWDWDGSNWNKLTLASNAYPHDALGGLVSDPQHNGLLGVFGTSNLTVWRWSQSTWTQLPWSTTSLRARYDAQTLSLNTATQQAYIAGGAEIREINSADVPRTTRMFDLTTSTWSIAHRREKPIGSPDGVYDTKRDQVFLVAAAGDFRTKGSPLTTWTWTREDGYRQLHPKTSPPGRPMRGDEIQGAVGYHASSGMIVLFGSFRQKNDTKTWVWNGSDWSGTQMPGPDPFKIGTFVWDTKANRLLYFVLRTTELWEWTPTKWNKLDPGDPNRLPVTTAVAFDSQRGVLVAHGPGWGGTPVMTWEWDGKQWLQLQPANSPPDCHVARLQYAPWLGGCVLVGGWINSWTFAQDTWLWDGINWQKLPVADLPSYPTAGIHAAITDPNRQRILTFFNPYSSIDNVFELSTHTLSTDTEEVSLGKTITFTLDLPQEPNKTWVLGLSFALRPAIPLFPNPVTGFTRFPLANDILLAASLQYGLGGVLDQNGKASYSIPVPNDPSLAWRKFYGSAITVSSTPSIDTITNALDLLIIE